MKRELFTKALSVIGLLLAGCVANSSIKVPVGDSRTLSTSQMEEKIAQRLTAVVVTNDDRLQLKNRATNTQIDTPSDASAGSAVPITPDGYFLTANHVLEGHQKRNVILIHQQTGTPNQAIAEVVWSNYRNDFALLYVPILTPHYYRWTPEDLKLEKNDPIVHGGIFTGGARQFGKLRTPFTVSHRAFTFDLPLQPGDSGGPVLDRSGNLIGINLAVEFLMPMETAIYVESEGVRPNLNKLYRKIARHRMNKSR